MTLGDLWFIVDVLFWVGFFVLEGSTSVWACCTRSSAAPTPSGG